MADSAPAPESAAQAAAPSKSLAEQSSGPAHRIPARIAAGDAVAVIGLGRFGSAVALGLMDAGVEVLGIDSDITIVDALADHLTFAAQADSTSTEALQQLAVPEFDKVVVGIGANLSASVLTVSHLIDFGVPEVWAKAVSDDHARILRQLGLANVIQPEAEIGQQLAGQIAKPASP
ncbi:MAG: hypothetical protein RLZ55_1642 [Actinomycetota bacterium]